MKPWYKISSEYVGFEATYGPTIAPYTIQDTKVRNISNEGLPADLHGPDILEAENPYGVPSACPICHTAIEPFEIMGFENDDGTTVYKCKHCGHTNNQFKLTVKRKSRINKRRSSSQTNIKTAAPFATPSYNNPANTPYGRMDVSEDLRVVPWQKIHPDVDHTWNSHKQKPLIDYKIKKVRDKGKTKFVKVKEKSTGVQPANSYFHKGRISQHPRYKPETGPSGSQGSWPHNRAPTPEDGWYGSQEQRNKFNADGRQRYMEWTEYIQDRDKFMMSMGKPY